MNACDCDKLFTLKRSQQIHCFQGGLFFEHCLIHSIIMAALMHV
jgi:hypothetical protein